MVKVVELTPAQLKQIDELHPAREKGKWEAIIKKVQETKKGVQLTEITRGQAWSIRRKCRELGAKCRVLDEGDMVVISP